MDKTNDIIADLEARHAKGGKPDNWESAQRYLAAQHGHKLDISKRLVEGCTWQAVAKAVREQSAPAKAARKSAAKTKAANEDQADRTDQADQADRTDRIDQADQADRIDQADQADQADQEGQSDLPPATN